MINLANAVCYDVETLPNCFTLHMELLHSEASSTWEISAFRDDRQALFAWFNYLHQTQTPMIGFFSLKFDYPLIHWLFFNPNATVQAIYEKSRQLAKLFDGFSGMFWERDRFAPQIDLFKIHHMDNRAKTTSLKALQINMRSPTVLDSPIPFDVPVTSYQIDHDVIPYNKHDVKETKRFAFYSMGAIEFRLGLIDQFGVDVLNYNDGKIGAKTLEQRLGDDVCYDRSSGRRVMRQTPRNRIALSDIIFPYIRFDNPEFARVLEYMKTRVLRPDDLDDPDAPLKTKGAISISADVGGLEFKFGTGGVHASVSAQRFAASGDWIIRDIDVAGLYPNIAIVNGLAPEHLGQAFVQEYKKIPEERAKHKKGTYPNAMFKLAANVPWGQSNNKYTIFFDPKYAMTIPINGQLMICMLVERLIHVPTLTLIQANTDGVTYRIHRSYEPFVVEICKWWQQFTCLKLEDANYNRMWIRDVNNYVAEHESGKLKQIGAYWHPDPFDYANSISNSSPPAWHKDLSALVTIRAAVAAMVHGIEPETYIRVHSDPFDFMCRARATQGSSLVLGGAPVQRTFRYYVAREGAPLVKISPPAGPAGAWKRRNGVSETDYNRRMAETGGEWCETVCTKNRSKYEQRETAVEAGWKVADCCDASRFRFDNVDYAWYVNEAKKLII
jgi:hypothetical protein